MSNEIVEIKEKQNEIKRLMELVIIKLLPSNNKNDYADITIELDKEASYALSMLYLDLLESDNKDTIKKDIVKDFRNIFNDYLVDMFSKNNIEHFELIKEKLISMKTVLDIEDKEV